jgi:hypothetical protein
MEAAVVVNDLPVCYTTIQVDGCIGTRRFLGALQAAV